MPTNKQLALRLDTLRQITIVFAPERFTYLAIVGISAILLLTSGGMIIIKQGVASAAELSLLFGSSGVVTVTAGMALRMWTRAIALILGSEDAGNQL
jgi:hypothetical protein